MLVGVVLSYKESFFSFKQNKILVRLTTPVFQIVVQEKGITCISKQLEFHLSSDLNATEALVMGKKLSLEELKLEFINLKSRFWISRSVDASNMEIKLNGMAKTCDGKVLFLSDFDSLSQSYMQIQKYANQETTKNKDVIKQYCEKNIDLLNNQIRLLSQDRTLYQELLNTL